MPEIQGTAAPVAQTQQPSTPDANKSSDSSFLTSENNIEAGDSQDYSSDAEIDAALNDGDLTSSQAKDMKKKLKLKVDGAEEDFEIDLANEDELKKHFQKSKSFDKRLKEFSGFKSNFEKFIEKLKTAPDSVLEELGIDVDKFSEERIQKKLEQMSKSPEQIEREKMQAELEQLRKEKEEAAKAKETAEQEALMNKSAMEIESSIIKAMDKASTILPKNNEVIGQIAKAMKEAMARGYNEVTVDDVVPIVEKRYKEQLAKLFDALPEEAIELVVGKNNLDRLRKKRLAKMAPPTSKNVGRDTGASALEKSRAAESKEDKPKRTYKDFFKS